MTASVELVAQLARPKGVERFRIKDRAMWHALRAPDVTASVAPALFGIHEYQSEYSLWATKSGKMPPVEETKPMKRGTLLEPVAASLLREDYADWQVLYPVAYYYRDAANRIVCTPDIFAVDPARPGFGNVQVKSVEPSIFRSKWRQEDGTVEPPLWIAVQSSIEAALTGASWAAVAPLVIGHGIDMPLIEVPIHQGVMTKLRALVPEFWRRVEENDPPSVDFEKDADTIRVLYAGADEGKTIDLSDHNRIYEILDIRDRLKAREADGNEAEKERKRLDDEIKVLLGDAAFGRLRDGRLVSAKTINRKSYTVAASSYRSVTIKKDDT